MSRKSELKTVLSYAGFYGHTFEDFLEIAASNHFTGIQLIPDQEPNLYTAFDGSRGRRLQQLIKRHNLEVHLHNVFYDINLVSLVPEVRAAAFKITKAVFHFGRTIGAKSLTVHPGYMFPGWRKDPIQNQRFWINARLAMRELRDLGQESEMEVLIENGSYAITTLNGMQKTPLHVGIFDAEIAQLLDDGAPSLRLCVDTGKAIASGLGVEDLFEKYAPKIGQAQVASSARLEEFRPLFIDHSTRYPAFSVVLEGGADHLVST